MKLTDVLVHAHDGSMHLCQSKSEARRQIAMGAIKVNGATVSFDLELDGVPSIRVGKRTFTIDIQRLCKELGLVNAP